MTEKLKEQVTSTIRQQDAEANGSTDVNGDAAGMVPNGNAEHANGDGDVEMADGQDGQASQTALEKTARRDTKQSDILPDLIPELDPDLVSPSEGELLPPPPSGLFRTSDVKREVETIRDKRKLIRLGVQDGEGAGVTPVLPSVVAFTVFDSGEGCVGETTPLFIQLTAACLLSSSHPTRRFSPSARRKAVSDCGV
jgi:transcription initiation factor TFIID subunit 5